MLLAILFFSIYFFFLSTFYFKMLLLFFSFFCLVIFLIFLLSINTTLSLFNLYSFSYKFDFFNFTYCFLMDSLSLYFIILTVFLFIICILLGWNLKYKLKEFLVVVLSITLFLINVFGVSDLFFFYVFFETLLIPMFLLIGIWGSRERKIEAAYQFFLYTLFGSLFMLLSLFFLYSHFGGTDFRLFLIFSITPERQQIFWIFFFFAIAVKVPMFPVHIWLPEAHVEAPTAGSVILAGVLLKLGLYALLKFLFTSFAAASVFYIPIVVLLSLLGIIYASCSTLIQIDMKKLVAYSSVAHMNFVVLGLFSFNFYGFLGSILLMLSHGLVSSGLFLCVSSLYDRYKTRLFIYFGGLISLMPNFSTFFLILVLANMGFPGTFSFIGEVLIFFGVIFLNLLVCLMAGFSMVLSAAYSLTLYNHTMLGNINSVFVKYFSDLSYREVFMLGSLAVLTVFFGIFPNLVILPLEGHISIYLDAVSSVILSN
jgi:proton-translocating NADH-quinone oxidoreductase, chain M